jgi:cytochrome P450
VEEPVENAVTVDRIPDATARAVVDPHAYAEWDRLQVLLTDLRKTHPFARGELDGYDPFWVASKYEDIQKIARQHELFSSRITAIAPSKELELDASSGTRKAVRSVVSMDEPEHMPHRLLTQPWFQPKNLRHLDERLRKLARRYVDRLADAGGECNFAEVAGVHYPLLVIMSILGVSDQDEEMMLKLAQQALVKDDPEYSLTTADEAPEARAMAAFNLMQEAGNYFNVLSEARRRNPTDDVATVIANATVDGRQITPIDALGYYLTIITAGHDTTSSSIIGALWALAERPGELAKVKANPALIPNLVEEAVRWTTPIHHFARTAVQDTVYRGQPITKGDRVILSYVSGNRDEDVFEEAFEFKVDRATNKHIGFGHGIHLCLGMHLARMEMTVFFQELLPRLDSLELAGVPRRVITNFVGGPKYLPIRYKMS